MIEPQVFLKSLSLAVLSTSLPSYIKPPSKITLYNVNGQTVFPLYAESGGLTMEQRSFLVCKKSGHVFSYGFDPQEISESDARKYLASALKSMVISGTGDIFIGSLCGLRLTVA